MIPRLPQPPPIRGAIIEVDIAPGVILDRAEPAGTAVVSIATAVDDAANPNLLLDCASTPEAAFCEHHDLPVQGRCGGYASDIYCDGYEDP